MNIQDFQKEVHQRNVEKGFYDYKADLALAYEILHDRFVSDESFEALSRILIDYSKLQLERKLLLVIGEIVEAHEELRAGHSPSEIYYNPEKLDKPEGFSVEIADAHIRLWDLEAAHGIDSEDSLTLKSRYNEGRAYKHGRQF